MAAKDKTCLFCGTTLGPRGTRGAGNTNEHVIPDWLLEHLGVKVAIVTPVLMRTEDGQIADQRNQTWSSFLAGGICSACNNGWMSDLENEVKPILIQLMGDPVQQLPKLSESHRLTLARWTMKTAAVLNRSSAYSGTRNEFPRTVPDAHLRALRAGGLPADVLLVGSAYPSQKTIDWLQYAVWTKPENSMPLNAEHRERSYKIAIAFRDLVLIAAYYPSPDYAYGINQNHYVVLHCHGRRVVPINHLMDWTPGKALSPNLEILLRNISVTSNTWLQLVENGIFTRLVQE